MSSKLNNYIQHRMQRENLNEVPLTTTARWLGEAGILKESQSNFGLKLRRRVYRGSIIGAYKKNGRYWHIKKIPDYRELLSPSDLEEVFELKNRTSIYRKIKSEDIPFVRPGERGMYFRASDLMKWAVERDIHAVLEKIQNKTSENKD